MSYFRQEIDAMAGYAPGEQPKDKNIIKLNTNENPYPPSPAVRELLASFDYSKLRLYPDPVCSELRETVAALYGFEKENVIAGNGSDDILTIAVRSFCDKEKALLCVDPTYSLYSALAQIQGAECIAVPLNEDFSLPDKLPSIKAGLLTLPAPNAPTGNRFEIEKIKKICNEFQGIVLIDEAYADFSENNCLGLVRKYPNVIVSRTLSKSYSLAGVRLGFAIAGKDLVNGMMKVKDSYNVNALTQAVACAALKDQEYFRKTVNKIKSSRKRLSEELAKLSFSSLPSEANFIFTSPPDENAGNYFEFLKANKIFVRYFPGERTGRYVRITVGTDQEIDSLLELTHLYLNGK
jgi:histidinol-phosphate aminotransferase